MDNTNINCSSALNDSEIENAMILFNNLAIDEQHFQDEQRSDDKLMLTLLNNTMPFEQKEKALLDAKKLGRLEAGMAIAIISNPKVQDSNPVLSDVIEVVQQCVNGYAIDRAINSLAQYCEICSGTFHQNNMLCQINCQCNICKECVKKYYTGLINEKSPKDYVCPMCQKPDKPYETEQYFLLLSEMLKNLLPLDIYKKFDEKLRDSNLHGQPNFRWCLNGSCGTGFDANPANLQVVCPKCSNIACFKCKRPWNHQHTGRTCEQYDQLLAKNDENGDGKKESLADQLQRDIICPNCNFKFYLVKGGCMHFTCTQCKYEFCSGCNRKMTRGKTARGLSAEHLRDCLYYLRDLGVSDLQSMLNQKNVSYIICTVTKYDKCLVVVEKELDQPEQPCGEDLNTAGLCEKHYKEYLVSIINKNKIDPICIMTWKELKVVYSRESGSLGDNLCQENVESLRQKIASEYPLCR